MGDDDGVACLVSILGVAAALGGSDETGALLLGIYFLGGVLEGVAEEIGEGRKGVAGVGSRIEGTGSAGLQTGELLVFVPVWRPALPGGLADGVEGGAGAHGGCSFGCIWLVVAGGVDWGALDGDEFGDDGFLVGGEVVG